MSCHGLEEKKSKPPVSCRVMSSWVEEKEGQEEKTSGLTARRVLGPLVSHGGRGCGHMSCRVVSCRVVSCRVVSLSCRSVGLVVIVVVVPAAQSCLYRRRQGGGWYLHPPAGFCGYAVSPSVPSLLLSSSAPPPSLSPSSPVPAAAVSGGATRCTSCFQTLPKLVMLRAAVMIQWLASWRR